MRSLNTLKNMIASMTCEIMMVLFGLVVPRLIIDAYGSEVNGLTSTIHQILQILNLLQAGAVGASIFQMYKPVAERDYQKISVVLYASKRYFRKIGGIFLLLILIVAPIMSIMTKSEIAVWEKMFAFIILGVNGAFYFFFTSWFDILFSSHQKRFVLSVASIIDKLVYYGFLFVVILLRLHFLWMYVVVMLGTVSKVVYLYLIYSREFKHKLVKTAADKTFKIANKGYLLCNQIATQAVDSLPTVLITAMHGLAMASVYAVYNLVQNTIKMIVRTFQLSVSEVFGNLVASEDTERVQGVYNLLEFVFFIVAVVLCSCACFLFIPFIYLYTDCNSFDVNYIYPVLSLVIVAYDLFYCMYMPSYTLTNVLGLYKETYKQAVVSAVLATVLAIGLGSIHWPLVMLGPVFYYMTSLIYRMYVAKKNAKWMRVGSFIRRMLTAVIAVLGAFALSGIVYAGGYSHSWGAWLLQAVLCGATVLVISGIYVLLFERREIKMLLRYGKALLKKKTKKV